MSFEVERELLTAKLPLWLAFPEIPRYSIGWRMGAGEDYVMAFGNWWEKLSLKAQQEYQQRYPEPADWHGWYSEKYLYEDDESDN